MRKRKLLFTLLAAATLMVNTSVWAESDSEIENNTRYTDYESEIYGNQVNIGVITCPLADIAELDGSYDVLIELDESTADESKPDDSKGEESTLLMMVEIDQE